MQKLVESPKTKILQYTITFGVCALLSFGLACLLGLFTNWEVLKARASGWTWRFYDEYSKNMHVWCNATFIVGIFSFGFGMLFILSNGGAFEMLAYGMTRFFSLFKRDPSKVRFQTFYDYHTYRSGEPKRSFLFMVIIGLLFVGLSMMFMILWNNAVTAYEAANQINV